DRRSPPVRADDECAGDLALIALDGAVAHARHAARAPAQPLHRAALANLRALLACGLDELDVLQVAGHADAVVDPVGGGANALAARDPFRLELDPAHPRWVEG